MVRRIALIVASLAVCAPAARASVTPIAPVAAPTAIASIDKIVVWSSYDAATHDYRLMWNRGPGGAPEAMAVAPRSVPFDASAGRAAGSSGRPVLTYSRCAVEPAGLDAAGLPDWSTARGCRLYEVSLDTGTGEHPISGTHERGASEYLPSTWDGAVAFARSAPGAAPAVEYRPARGAARRLPGGDPGSHARLTGIDLMGDRLAFTWEVRQAGNPVAQLRVDHIGGGRGALIDQRNGTDQCASQPRFPLLTLHTVTYAVRRTCAQSVLERYVFARRPRRETATNVPRRIDAFTASEGRTWAIADSTLSEIGAPHWVGR